MSFSYFDPGAKGYETQKTPPLHLFVTAGAGSAAGGGNGQNVLEASFRPLRTAPALSEGQLPVLRGNAIWLTLGLPPLLLALLWSAETLRRRRRDAAPAVRMRQAYRVARKRIKVARTLLAGPSPGQALGELTAALVGYLEDRAGTKLAGLSHVDLAERLGEMGATDEAAKAAVAALEACEAHRYAPGSGGAESGKDLLSRVEWAIDALERSDWQKAA